MRRFAIAFQVFRISFALCLIAIMWTRNPELWPMNMLITFLAIMTELSLHCLGLLSKEAAIHHLCLDRLVHYLRDLEDDE